MDVPDYLAALRREGGLLAAAASRTALDTPIPTCPGWTMRDLVRHTGGVHRWAAAHVRDGRPDRIVLADPGDIVEALPGDGALVDWFREGHAALADTLESADPDTACWTFLKAPSPLAFWSRRQAHETGIHRADAESPGGRTSPFTPEVAADGIDELLSGLVPRPKTGLRADIPRTLRVETADTGDGWLVRIGPDRAEVTRESGDADCAVRGPAAELYLLLWNRRGRDGLDVQGDAALLGLWRDSVQVRWG